MDGGGDEIIDGSVPIMDGPFAGWRTWHTDPFETQSGPFYFKHQDDGAVVCAMVAEKKHMNGGDAMHGGCMMTFADFSLFALSGKERGGAHAVTVSLNGEFLGPAFIGETLTCTGAVTKAGGSLIFVRGLLAVGDRPVLSFSGVIKKLRPRAQT
jgi:uncharacterized protein (TIGR00369 family)